jgi:hypothetical protein
MSKTKESKFLVVGQNILLYSDEETDDSGTGRSGSGFEEEGGGDSQEEEEGSEESTEDGKCPQIKIHKGCCVVSLVFL